MMLAIPISLADDPPFPCVKISECHFFPFRRRTGIKENTRWTVFWKKMKLLTSYGLPSLFIVKLQICSINIYGENMNIRMIGLFLSLTIAPVYLLNANILNVPSRFPTIQNAMDSAAYGDTVLVAPGTYYENVHFRGKGITLASHFVLNHDTSYVSTTIINGGSPAHTDTGSCILMNMPDISTALDTSAEVIGFTLTDGTGSVFEDEAFPGTYYREGGGIFIQYWSPRIRFNRILNNHIDTDPSHPNGGGGAIRSFKGNPTIENNVMLHNSGHCGMAVNFYYSSGVIRNNIIAGNSGAIVWRGGAVYCFSNYLSYPILIANNTIANNAATDITCTGGLRLYNSSFVTVKNNILWGNYPTQIYRSGTDAVITFNDMQGGYGTGNINIDPEFQSYRFYLSPSSPCIDAGDTNAIFNDPENTGNPGYALWPAQGNVRNDIGAFGGPFSAVVGTATVIDLKDYGSDLIISGLKLYQNYPNPFNPSTTLRYELAENSRVLLKIYNILGQEVRTLVNGFESAGLKQKVWDGKDLDGKTVATGVYLYHLQINTEDRIIMKSRKMIMVK